MDFRIEEEAKLNELSYVEGGIVGEGRLVKDEATTEAQMPTLLTVHFERGKGILSSVQ
jgi:hypothetical protein